MQSLRVAWFRELPLSIHTSMLGGGGAAPAALRNAPFEWNAALSEATRAVKDLIRHTPRLDMFDPTLATVLTTDASDEGRWACLSQIGRGG